MKLKKVLALVLSAALVVSAFAGCGGKSSSSTTSTESIAASESSAESTESTASGDSTPAASGDATAIFTPKTVDAAKTISLNAGMEPTGLNTLTSTYAIEFSLFKHMYENLVTLDDDDNTVPGAAESWDYDEDTLTYTFHLRKDGVWTNGDPVTAKDFEFAWSQALNPDVASDYAYFLYFIKNAEKYFNGEVAWDEVGVKVVDDYTLEVTMEQPTPYALFLFSFGTLAPINQRFYEAVGADLYSTEAQYFCTNGPFALTEWSHNDKIVMQKNDAWHGAADVEVEEIDWKIIIDANAALSSFLAGDLDMVGLDTGELIKQAEAAGATIQSYTDGTSFYIYFNNNDQYLSNVNLRRALFNAIDEQKEIDTVWQNDNEPMTSFTAPGVSATDGTSFAGKVGELYAPSRDQEKAKEYLATALSELGCTVDELSAHLSIDCGDSATSIAEASFYQEQWRQVLGIEVTVNSMITKQGSQNRKTGNYVMSITGWGPDYNDPNTFLDLWVTDGGNNQTGFSNERYDELIDLAAKETDLEKRESYFIECEQIIADQLPIGPAFWRAPSYACSDKIKGGMHRSTFQDINAVYVKLS
ncbi:MAG: peptide ABC transporter substrate-binding protein [Hominenteromicrobium sp.]|uniref:peptide ABC transporter substrate-binding protein n=1 Tax=Hominenteromicrobium sp. TaxID=3073581 RepID=UPI00399148C4